MCAVLKVDSCRHWFATTSSANIFNFRINPSQQHQSIVHETNDLWSWVICETEHTNALQMFVGCFFVMIAKSLAYECKHWHQTTLCSLQFVHAPIWFKCCRNWGLQSWQNWFREGSQRANDTWNDYYEKEIKCPYSSEASLFPTCSAALCQCLRAGRKAKAGKTSTPRATSGS